MNLNELWNLKILEVIRTDDKPLGNIPQGVITASGQNKTKDSRILIYNKVPKVGSSTMKILLITLSKLKGFKVRDSVNAWQWVKNFQNENWFFISREQVTSEEERRLINEIFSVKGKYVYLRHLFVFEEKIFKESKVRNVKINNKVILDFTIFSLLTWWI